MIIDFGKLSIIIGISSLVYLSINGIPIPDRFKPKPPNPVLDFNDLKKLTITKNKLTIATGEPAYEPWVIDDKPKSGKGFEAAVAYAIAYKLGYENKDVVWVRTTFDDGLKSGSKNFDFNLQQYSITDKKKVVDFSSPYYTLTQAVVTFKGSKIDTKNISLKTLKGKKIGAANSTSIDAITNQIGVNPIVFNDKEAVVLALKNKKIDAIVTDLPTAFYLSGVEIENGLIFGQLPSTGFGEQFGLVLEKDNEITPYINKAIEELIADGTLAEITEKWLVKNAGVPIIKI